MTMRYSVLIKALFASLMLSQAPAHADGLEDVVKRGTLKVAVPQDFPPFGSVGPDMKPRGLDIDTAKLLADQLKVKLELTPVNSTNRIPFLTTGKVDLVISSLGKNPEREKKSSTSPVPTHRSTSPCSARQTPPSRAWMISRAKPSASPVAPSKTSN
ncbi:transporter substrate-binding domain-containing protein [Pseudomonas lini]